MSENFKVRTDLALEAREEIKLEDSQLKGVIVEEKEDVENNIKIIKLTITNEHGEKLIGKPIGTYITLEASQLGDYNEEYHREISCALAKCIKELIKPYWRNKEINILVVGLGNREVTPDALGPNVVSNIAIRNDKISIGGIIPGVMAQTGMETASIIRGVVAEAKPDVVIAIDALAARNSKRLNSTIQVTDTGIHPGSGVGNHRKAVTKESIGTNVIAIGVPTVIDTPTIVYDTLENLLQALSLSDSYKTFDDSEKYQLIKELLTPELAEMFMTPKDVDETIKRISYTISEAINIAVAD